MGCYDGEYRKEIAFPLGGIGAGSVSLDGMGRLRDWEIFNHPNKGSVNGFSHFGIKAERDGETIDARILNADLIDGYMGELIPNARFHGYGFGPSRYLLGGVPHFRESDFTGEFPFAQVRFMDDSFPGEASLCAFSPFIPGNADDSSLPAAFFEVEVTNTTGEALTYCVEFTVQNPGKACCENRLLRTDDLTCLELTNHDPDAVPSRQGSLLIAIPREGEQAAQQYWYRGRWFDELSVFWRDFTAPGLPENRVLDVSGEKAGGEAHATLFASACVRPGETFRQRFLMTWYYPLCENDWSPKEGGAPWRNYYATLFEGADDVAHYAYANWERLEAQSRLFQRALYSSSLPEPVLDAVSANLAVLKSPTCLRLTQGQFYGFEGCHANEGSCEGSCTHVWNYQFALPFLFPDLERSMRELDYTYNLTPYGGMGFRLQLPLGSGQSSFRPCVDGQMGGIIKMHREWKISGDTEWLRRWWPRVKQSLAYVWSAHNPDRWDPERTGVISGRQHHTLDMELFGPNGWLNGFYLGALKAAAEMARSMQDDDFADQCDRLYQSGRAYTDEALFNGEYYIQRLDLKDPSVLQSYLEGDALTGGSAQEAYWSAEHGEIKYQIGEGCAADQTLAQCICRLSGVGEILNPAHVHSALTAIYRYNFKPSLRFHFNPCRLYGLQDEGGLVICEWPKGRVKPWVPVPYAEECMNGFEYQAAAHMLLCGMEREGLEVVRAVRARYNGRNRNPWNEFECGSNYARSMASYALLLAYSGFEADMTRGRIGFTPLSGTGTFFWSIGKAWGKACIEPGQVRLDVLYGALPLRELAFPGAANARQCEANGRRLAFRAQDAQIVFDEALCLSGMLTVDLRPTRSA